MPQVRRVPAPTDLHVRRRDGPGCCHGRRLRLRRFVRLRELTYCQNPSMLVWSSA